MIETVLEPVVRCALRVLLERFAVLCRGAIELRPLEQHALQAEQPRAVRIAFLLAVRMMPAVNGDPLASRRAGVHPQPKAADVANDGMQVDGTVRLIAVVIERHRHHGGVQPQQRDDDIADPSEVGEAVEMLEQEIHGLLVLVSGGLNGNKPAVMSIAIYPIDRSYSNDRPSNVPGVTKT